MGRAVAEAKTASAQNAGVMETNSKLGELQGQIRSTNELCQTVLKQMSKQLHSFQSKLKAQEDTNQALEQRLV